jgi:hypothetical protein
MNKIIISLIALLFIAAMTISSDSGEGGECGCGQWQEEQAPASAPGAHGNDATAPRRYFYFPENQEKRRAFELNKNEFLTMPLPVQLMPEGMSCHFSYFLR